MVRIGCSAVLLGVLLLPMAARADCHHRRLDKVMDHGRVVQLDDGSEWEIAEFDRSQAERWLEDATITACDTELINTEDHETADARMVRRGLPVPEAR